MSRFFSDRESQGGVSMWMSRYHHWMLANLHTRHHYEEMLTLATDREMRCVSNFAQKAIALMAEEAVS
jgi:hypothetical protein